MPRPFPLLKGLFYHSIWSRGNVSKREEQPFRTTSFRGEIKKKRVQNPLQATDVHVLPRKTNLYSLEYA